MSISISFLCYSISDASDCGKYNSLGESSFRENIHQTVFYHHLGTRQIPRTGINSHTIPWIISNEISWLGAVASYTMHLCSLNYCPINGLHYLDRNESTSSSHILYQILICIFLHLLLHIETTYHTTCVVPLLNL